MTHPSFATTLISATSAFAATNLDEILLLSLFFADARLRPRAVVAGHCLGIAAIVAVSVLTGWAALVVPHAWIRWLGLIPLAIGLKKLLDLFRGADDDDDDDVLTTPSAGFASQTLGVAGVAIANGGDNLSVYIPMFAARPDTIAVYVTVFGVLTAGLCVLGFALVHNRLFGSRLQQLAKLALPIVLVLLGLQILSE